MAKALEVKGRKIVANGILNVGNMSIECEGVDEPVSIAMLIKSLDGQMIKIVASEGDRELTGDDLEEIM